jgi:hypothetical protein
MGGFFSFVRSPNAAETKTILNNLLKEMFTRTDLIDLYSLADPEQCKRYIVVATTALDKLFIKINLEPKEGRKGEFYFQRIDGIQKANPMREQQTANCRKLAFFFIRIFQVYAALTISILDTDLTRNPEENPRDDRLDRRQPIRFHDPPRVPGFGQAQSQGWLGQGQSQSRGGLLGYFGIGGRLSSTGSFALPPGDYAILNQYLLTPDSVESKSALRFERESYLRIPQVTLYTLNDGPPFSRTVKDFTDQKPIIEYVMRINDTDVPCSAKLVLMPHNDDAHGGVEVKLEEVKIGDKQTGPFSRKLYRLTSDDTSPVTKSREELPAVLKAIFKEGYEKVTPFSAVTFLRKHDLIKELDGTVPIERTDIYIKNPREQTGMEIPITFNSKLQVSEKDETKRKVAVKVKLKIEKEERPNPSREPQFYSVRVIFKDMTTEPTELKDLLRSKEFRERIFTTGMSDSSTPTDEKGGSVSSYLRDVFEELVKGVGQSYREGGIQYSSKGIPEPFDSSSMPPHMRIKELWGALAKNPPIKAHCSARALQLLSAAGITGEAGSKYSSVCRVKFPYIVDRSLPSVEQGKPLTSDYGIYALAMLFVDTIEHGMPQITSAAEFKTFSQNFNEFFRGYEGIPVDPATSLDRMQNSMLPFCQGHERDIINLENDRGTLSALQYKVRILQNRQAQHVQSAMLLIFRLFDETAIRAGRMEFNVNILNGGLDAVNAIGVEARKLLIAYYGDCEKTYKEGLVLLDKKGADALTWSQQD